MKRLTLLLVLAGLALAQGLTCAIDGLPMLITGRVRPGVNGMLREYRCARGHLAWAP